MRALHVRHLFAFAVSCCLAGTASASFLTCSESVSVHEGSFQPAVSVDAFPAPLTYRLTATEAFCAWCATQPDHWCHQSICPGNGASVVLNETDAVLASLLGQPIAWSTTNPDWMPPFPFWLFNGESITTTVNTTLWSYADCATRARSLSPPIHPDASGTVTIPDTYRVEWNLDGVPPYYAECSAQVTCLPPVGPTRTLGYFKTHPDAVAACLAGGAIDLGFFTIGQGDASRALGLLSASPAKYDDGTKRSSLDQARVLLGRQLLVALCNGRVFGSSPEDPELLAAARNVLAGATCANASWLTSQLDAFNNSGDTGESWFGSATPGTYRDPTPRTGYACP